MESSPEYSVIGDRENLPILLLYGRPYDGREVKDGEATCIQEGPRDAGGNCPQLAESALDREEGSKTFGSYLLDVLSKRQASVQMDAKIADRTCLIIEEDVLFTLW